MLIDCIPEQTYELFSNKHNSGNKLQQLNIYCSITGWFHFFSELSHETTDGSEIQNKLYDLNHIMSQDWHNNPDQVGRRMFPSQCKWHFLWLFVYLLYHHYFFSVPSLIDCHCISFFTINRTAERKMYLKDNAFLVDYRKKKHSKNVWKNIEFG